MAKESICRNCFHSYVCEQFNENKDDNNEKCHFANDHYIPRADVVPKSEVEKWKEINVQLHKEMSEQMIEERKIERKYVAREIFEEIGIIFLQYYKGLTNGEELKLLEPIKHAQEFLLNELVGDIAELKKKYTEGDLNGNTE